MTGSAAATLALLAGGVTLAQPASAATTHSCTFVNGGYLCTFVTSGSEEWRASFLNQSSTTKRLRFTLHCKQDVAFTDPNESYEDDEDFDAPPGQVKSFVWDRYRTDAFNESHCATELKDIRTGVTYPSPMLAAPWYPR